MILADAEDMWLCHLSDDVVISVLLFLIDADLTDAENEQRMQFLPTDAENQAVTIWWIHFLPNDQL